MSDLFNNVFSDLGPLISLFGENFATQFLSESFTTWDHIVFAMGPVGIVTAFIGATRLAGPAWLRAIIGLAQENRGDAEAALCSSTSASVCELWNGQSVTRAVGDPNVKQVVVLRSEKDKDTFGLYTLDKAMEVGLIDSEEYNGASFADWIERVRSFFGSKRDVQTKGAASSLSQTNGNFGDVLHLPKADIEVGHEEKKPYYGAEDEQAPNILLNLHYSSKIEDLIFASFIGVALQGGVLIYGAFVTYLGSLNRAAKAYTDTVAYGYPLMAAGTVLMTVGLIISASVIERSSTERRWFVKERRYTKESEMSATVNSNRRARRLDSEMQVVWLQKQQSLGPHTFDAYVLRAVHGCNEVFTSHPTREVRTREKPMLGGPIGRIKSKAEKSAIVAIFDKYNMSVLTVIGVLVGLVGFVVQFQGIRSVDWTISVAQLGTVIIMSTLRAWLRRGLITKPHFTPTTSDHEMDCLASRMASGVIQFWPQNRNEGDDRDESQSKPRIYSAASQVQSASTLFDRDDKLAWSLLLAYDGSVLHSNHISEDNETPGGTLHLSQTAQKAMDIRCRLGAITGWVSPVSDYAKSTGAAIQEVMTRFLKSGEIFVWQFDIPFEMSACRVTIRIGRESSATPEQAGEWEDVSSKIEAALSLWLYHAKNQGLGQADALDEKVPYRWILGPDMDGRLTRDMAWWSGTDLTLQKRRSDQLRGKRKFGYCGLHSATGPENAFPETSIQYLTVKGKARMEQILAWNIFSNFMWAIASRISRADMSDQVTFNPGEDFDIYDHKTWSDCKIDSPALGALLRELVRTDLGDLEDIAMLVIPALSYRPKLPSATLVDFVRDQVRDHETVRHWGEVLSIYRELISLTTGLGSPGSSDSASIGVSDYFRYKAIAAVVEFLINLHDADSVGHWEKAIQEIKDMLLDVPEDRSDISDQDTAGPDTFRSTRAQSSNTPLRDVLINLGGLYHKQGRLEEYIDLFKELRDARSEFNDAEKAIQDDEQLGNLLGWTDSHRAVFIHKTMADRAYVATWSESGLSQDILGWSCLHYAAVLRPDVYEIAASELDVSSRSEPKDIAERTPLHHVARLGDWKAVRCLRKHSDINAVGRRNMLPIHWAAKRGVPAILEELIKYGSLVDVIDNSQRSPLYLATENGHIAAAKVLLAAGAQADTSRLDGESALHQVARLGDVRLLRHLLDGGAKLGSKGRDSQTVLQRACDSSSLKAAEFLVSRDPTLVQIQDRFGRTPLHVAARNDSVDLANYLLNQNADIDVQDHDGNSPLLVAALNKAYNVLELLYSRGADKQSTNARGDHPLTLRVEDPRLMRIVIDHVSDLPNVTDIARTAWILATENSDEAVSKMLEHRMPYAVDRSSLSIRDMPLFRAVIQCDASRVRQLIRDGHSTEVTSSRGETPLMLAVRHGWDDMAHILLQSGAKSGTLDSDGLGLLHKAATGGHASTIKVLWHSGVTDVDGPTKTSAGDSPLILASRHGHAEAVRRLLHYHAQPDYVNMQMETPIKVAIDRRHSDVVLTLISEGANIDTTLESLEQCARAGNDIIIQAVLEHPSNQTAKWQQHESPSTGWTLMQTAVDGGYANVVNVLLRAGVRPDLQISGTKGDPRFAGYTALHLAVIRGHSDIAELLLDHGFSPKARNSAGRTPAEEMQVNCDEHVSESKREAMTTLLSDVD